MRWLDDSYTSRTRAAVFFAGVGLVVCQLAINTIDNAFSAGMDLAGLFPKYINIRRGAYIAFVISIAMCPWELLASAGTFISVMSAYSVFLGPMCGIQICDYWVIRSRRLKLSDLFYPGKDGIFWFWRGFNWRSFIAWVFGFTTQLPGFVATVNPSVVIPTALMRMYYLAYPLGCKSLLSTQNGADKISVAISFLFYWAICKLSPPAGAGEIDDADYYGTFTTEEAMKYGMRPFDSTSLNSDVPESEHKVVGVTVQAV